MGSSVNSDDPEKNLVAFQLAAALKQSPSNHRASQRRGALLSSGGIAMFRSVRSASGFRHRTNRRLVFECIEARRLLAGDVASPWHNAANPLDVTGDTFVTAADALHVLHYLGEFGESPVPSDAPAGPPFFDVNNDSFVSNVDVNLVMDGISDALNGVRQNPRNALDVNDNGAVNLQDALIVQDYLQKELWGLKQQSRRGEYLDVNGDGSVTTADQSQISMFLAPVNTPPSAVGEDLVLADSDRTLVVSPTQGLLRNDTDANGDPLRVVLVDGPTNGTIVLSETGGFTYQPNPGFIGEDSFTYQVDDGRSSDNLSNVATASIKVRDSAFNPVARPDAYSTTRDTTLTVEDTGGLLANDEGRLGEIFVLRNTDPEHGTLTFPASSRGRANGAFSYTPDPGFVGIDSFTYLVIQDNPSDPHPFRWSDVVTVEILVEDPARSSVHKLDVTADGAITAYDVLVVVNFINAGLTLDAEGESSSRNLDVNGNGAVTAADALAIINHINAGFGGPLTADSATPAEGESAADPTLDELALLFATDAEQGPATRRKS
jgi:hypothetical protein